MVVYLLVFNAISRQFFQNVRYFGGYRGNSVFQKTYDLSSNLYNVKALRLWHTLVPKNRCVRRYISKRAFGVRHVFTRKNPAWYEHAPAPLRIWGWRNSKYIDQSYWRPHERRQNLFDADKSIAGVISLKPSKAIFLGNDKNIVTPGKNACKNANLL